MITRPALPTGPLVALLLLALAAVMVGLQSDPPAASQPAESGSSFVRPVTPSTDGSFARDVDLRALGRVAVQYEGRLKSFDSHATSLMRLVTGPSGFDGQSATFTYLDLILRGERYHDLPLIYIKKKMIRERIVVGATIGRGTPEFDAWSESFMDTGMISEFRLHDPGITTELERLNRDLVRTARFVDAINTAVAVSDPGLLLAHWKIVPPASNATDRPWIGLDALMAHDQGMTTSPLDIDPAHASSVMTAWRDLVNAWMTEDAVGVNAAAGSLASLLPTINADVYPSTTRLKWESFYFRAYNLTWFWVFYALCLPVLLLSVIFRWRGAHWIGLAIFMAAFGAHTFALGLRWYVAGRWPNTNMFEAVTTAAWFGGCAAVILELFVRRSGMRSVFSLSSAVASMVALMCAFYMPLQLDAGISNRMPVLHDVWLYIHTNVIILSYCLIFMAACTATLYLILRGIGVLRGVSGTESYARVGGAASLIARGRDGGSYLGSSRSGVGQVLDGSTMVLMELSFVLLWAGIVMGAIWADHSWGRPWGWDPKEVFALNTFIVFAILIHVRMKTRDKGLWTALIALFGAGVMLFNWIAINFVITGLHSYA